MDNIQQMAGDGWWSIAGAWGPWFLAASLGVGWLIDALLKTRTARVAAQNAETERLKLVFTGQDGLIAEAIKMTAELRTSMVALQQDLHTARERGEENLRLVADIEQRAAELELWLAAVAALLGEQPRVDG